MGSPQLSTDRIRTRNLTILGQNDKLNCLTTRPKMLQSIILILTYFTFALDRYGAPRFDDITSDLVERLFATRRYVYAQRFPVGFHSRRGVHRVTEQAVTWHRKPHDARHHRAYNTKTLYCRT